MLQHRFAKGGVNMDLKEILKRIKNWCDLALDDNCNTIMYKYELVAILDFITNLQQINKNLTNSLNKKIDYKSRNNKAIDIAYEYSQIDGEHHKTWCIDQIVRALTDDNYNEFVKEYENNGEYKWNIGIAP